MNSVTKRFLEQAAEIRKRLDALPEDVTRAQAKSVLEDARAGVANLRTCWQSRAVRAATEQLAKAHNAVKQAVHANENRPDDLQLLWASFERLRLLAAANDIEPTWVGILLTLRAEPNWIGLTALARRLNRVQSTMTRAVLPLSDRGFITTRQNPADHRSTQVRITSEGLTLLQKLGGETDTCSPRASRWCGRCGACSCVVDAATCVLHGPASGHAQR